MRVAGSNGSDDAWIPSLLLFLQLLPDWREVMVQHVSMFRRTHHSGSDSGGILVKERAPGKRVGPRYPTPHSLPLDGPHTYRDIVVRRDSYFIFLPSRIVLSYPYIRGLYSCGFNVELRVDHEKKVKLD